MNDVKTRLGEAIRRWFAPREIIIRTSGRIQFICLSTRAQLIASTLLGGVVIGALGASINLAVEQLHQYSRDIAVRQAESAYNELLTAFGDYVERAGDTIAAADAEVAALAARANTAGDTLPQAAQPGDMLANLSGGGDAALKSALRDRLNLFETDLRTVSERNKLLVGELSDLKRELQQAQFDRDNRDRSAPSQGRAACRRGQQVALARRPRRYAAEGTGRGDGARRQRRDPHQFADRQGRGSRGRDPGDQ